MPLLSGFKVHAKLLFVRYGGKGVTHLGTGNKKRERKFFEISFEKKRKKQTNTS